jgi:hypothetical protein
MNPAWFVIFIAGKELPDGGPGGGFCRKRSNLDIFVADRIWFNAD